ncbi:hypothetical protein RI367_007662 [Sorochytrium milnesiophthora]
MSTAMQRFQGISQKALFWATVHRHTRGGLTEREGPVSTLAPAELTPCFDQTVLQAVPSVLLIVVGVLRVGFLWRRPIKHSFHSTSLYVKLALDAVALCLAVGIAVLSPAAQDTSLVLGSSLAVVAVAVALVLQVLEWRKLGMSKSGVLTTYWLVRFAAGGWSLRTYKHYGIDQSMPTVFALYASATAVAGLSMLVESLVGEQRDAKALPEENASLFSRLSFAWITPLMVRGWKQTLTHDDLYDVGRKFQGEALFEDFHRMESKTTSKSQLLVWGLLRRQWVPVGLSAVAQGISLALTMLQPPLIKALIGFVQSYFTPSPQPVEWGYLYSALIFFVAVIVPILQQQAAHKTLQASVRIKVTLTHAIYEKALRLSATAKDREGATGVANHFSVDANSIASLIGTVNSIWSAPISIALALYFLYELLDVAAFCSIGILLICMPLLGVGFIFVVKQDKIKKENMDKRVKLMTDAVSAQKMIKLYAITDHFTSKIVRLRLAEQAALRRMWIYLSAIVVLHVSPRRHLSELSIVFSMLSPNGGTLTPERVFAALGYFGILAQPLGSIMELVDSISQALVGYRRIAKFMDSPEREANAVQRSTPDAQAVLIIDGTFAWTTKKDQEAAGASSTETDTEATPLLPVKENDAELVDGVFRLSDINLSVDNGTLVAVVGRVGQGKTALLLSMLGEMAKLSGRVVLNGSVAYCAQQPWIFNGSLRENILFSSAFDEAKYQTVLHACSLVTDLEILVNGDRTLIGDKGVNLSGGQKARIALARAVYANADVYLLDDCLSAVDAHVDKHIFSALFGPSGLLRSKTVVLVTHGVHHLSHCDRVVALKDGRVAEEGTFADLMAADSVVRALVEEFASNASDSSQHAISNAPTTAATDQPSTLDKAAAVADDDTTSGKVSWDVYNYYLRALSKSGVAVLVLFCILKGVAEAGVSLWMTHITDMIGSGRQLSLPWYLGVYGGIAAVEIFFMCACVAVTMTWLSMNASGTIHAHVLKRVFRAPMSWFDVTPSGRIINRFSTDITTLDESIPMSVFGAITMTLSALSSAVLVGISAPPALILAALLSVVLVFIGRFYLGASRELQRLTSSSTSPLYQQFTETVDGIITIRAFERTKQYQATLFERVDRNTQAQYLSNVSMRWLFIFLNMTCALVMLAVSLFSVASAGSKSGAYVGMGLVSAESLVGMLNGLIFMLSAFETQMVSVERLKQYGEVPQEAAEHGGNIAPEWPSLGDVSFNNYSVTYKPGLEPALKDLRVQIHGGQKIGICGRTGSGKSTITLSLFRIIEALQGSIVIDGQDISAIGLTDLRSRMTIIPQDPVLFQGTVRENLDPLGAHDDASLWRALEQTSLAEYVRGLEDKLDAAIDSGGSNLSGGQKQLLTLATALLRKRKVVILDEATSSTDMETDALVQRTIRSEFKDCTVLTIAHRIATIMDSDRILVLDQGRVAEFDQPAKLLQDSDSYFSKLVRDASAQRDQQH